MKEKAVRIVKVIIFCLLAVLMVLRINSILTIKGNEYGLFYNYAQHDQYSRHHGTPDACRPVRRSL